MNRPFLRIAIVLMGTGMVPMHAAAQQRFIVQVLSSPRPDLVSGGDALVEVRGASDDVLLTVNGMPSQALSRDPQSGRLIGLVTGLKDGPNRVVARSNGRSARLTLTNHSRNGPILSGPHIWPYECRTEKAGLGPAIDAMCNAPSKVERFYRSTSGSFKPWVGGGRPHDLSHTTTRQGRTVPYVVRVETGTLNRTIYRIAVLDEIDAPNGLGWRPSGGWNGRLAVGFGGGLAGRYEQGFNRTEDVLNDLYLSRGFAFMVASGLVNGLVSNAVIQGETLMMLKEHFIERYGVPQWTVGTGGSGGAIQQIHITALYPGLLDGLQPFSAYADSQVATQVLDCDLLQNFWSKADTANWTDDKKAAVAGFASAETCHNWQRFIASSLKPNHKPACGLTDLGLAYDRRTNPGGARCGMYNWLVNQLGRDPATGIPRSPLDNTGVQYGLLALNAGKISADEFLDLNEHVGGFTTDGDYSPARTASDEVTMRRLYASGLVNPGRGGLGLVPIIQYRNYQDPFGDIHDRQRDFEIRLRLIRANGDAANQVIWVGPAGRSLTQPSPVNPAPKMLDLMTEWLDALAADPAPISHAKVLRTRPSEAVDAFFDAKGAKYPAVATMHGRSPFNAAYPVYTNPRIVAGGPATNDVLKCRLKPVAMSDYKVLFSTGQQQRLRRIFQAGVCDFRKSGIGQVQQRGTFVRY